jgi:murein DD-endopeptidase MepM/ murein hydrolase activator NlpD
VRRAVVALAALALFALLAPPASAASDLAGAQKRANAAAARLNAAETALAKAEAEVASLQSKADSAGTRLRAAEGRVRTLAVRRYMDSGQRASQWWAESDLNQATRNQALLKFLLVGDSDSVAEYRTARADLDANRAAVAQRLAQQKDAVAKLRKERAAIAAELNRLAAAARAEEARRKASASAAARSRSTGGARPAGIIVTGSWVCPVQGPHAFSNDWHQPRSGGRLHQGNDILAPRGTPVVANVTGVVSRHASSLGGLSYYLRGADGNTYYGAHLQSYAAQGQVAAGTVIGYVGTSGNASGGPPHLHFEIHPGGGGAVNPYPTLVKFC